MLVNDGSSGSTDKQIFLVLRIPISAKADRKTVLIGFLVGGFHQLERCFNVNQEAKTMHNAAMRA